MSSMGLPASPPPVGMLASTVLTTVAAMSAAIKGTKAAEPALTPSTLVAWKDGGAVATLSIWGCGSGCAGPVLEVLTAQAGALSARPAASPQRKRLLVRFMTAAPYKHSVRR